MKRLNFSPVVLLILGCVPFLLMIVQWGAEDILSIGRVIDHMARWEVVFQVGVEMFLLGVILWCLDWVKEFIRLKKWRMEFVKDWQSNYKELDEEEARLEHLRREVEYMNKEVFMREYLCPPPFDEVTQQWIDKNNEYLGVPRVAQHPGISELLLRTSNGTKF